MIDIHCHILPGIDDGAADMEESLEMARMAARDGVKAIVATPHVRTDYHPVSDIIQRVDRLNRGLEEQKIPVRVFPGADCHAMLEPARMRDYSVNGTPYILIEFPHTHLPANGKDIIFQLRLQHLFPIITHPERNPSIVRDPGLLADLLQENVFVQITAGSLTGRFGRDGQKCALHLLGKKLVHFIASDAHSPHYRPPDLSRGLAVAEKILGRKEASRLVRENPARVLAGKGLYE